MYNHSDCPRTHFVDQGDLKFTEIRCLFLLSDGIKGLCHRAQLFSLTLERMFIFYILMAHGIIDQPAFMDPTVVGREGKLRQACPHGRGGKKKVDILMNGT